MELFSQHPYKITLPATLLILHNQQINNQQKSEKKLRVQQKETIHYVQVYAFMHWQPLWQPSPSLPRYFQPYRKLPQEGGLAYPTKSPGTL